MKLWFKLAVLTLAGIGSLVWVAVQIGQLSGAGGPLSRTYTVEAEFRDATGLVPGDEVTLAGVRIGTVGDVRVERGKAVTALKIDRAHRIPEGSRLELRWRTVLGLRTVQIVPPPDATPDGPAVAAGTRFPVDQTADVADLTALLDSTQTLLGTLDVEGLNQVMTTLSHVLETREEEVRSAISSSAEFISRLAGRADRLGETITDLATIVEGLAARDEEVTRLIGSLADASGALADRSGNLGEAIGESGEFLDVLDETLDANHEDLDVVIGQLAAVGDTVAAREHELSEGLRSLAWTSAALIRATNHGDWIQVYGRGFGVINTYFPEPRVGPDYDDVGNDDTDSPSPLLGQPRVPAPALPEVQVGPLTINPGGDQDERGGDGHDCGYEGECSDEGSSGLDLLFAPLRGGGGAR